MDSFALIFIFKMIALNYYLSKLLSFLTLQILCLGKSLSHLILVLARKRVQSLSPGRILMKHQRDNRELGIVVLRY